MTDEQVHEPGEATYAEYFHPARPRSLRYRTRVKTSFERHSVRKDGAPDGTNPTYVSWLLNQSMLADANTISRQFSGQSNMWQNPYANPDPRHAVESASVWFTAYPISLITHQLPIAPRPLPQFATREVGGTVQVYAPQV